MSNVTLIIMCAGTSSRFDYHVKKQWLRLDNEPLWLHVTKRLSSYAQFSKIIITSHHNELNYMKNFSMDYTFVQGGNTRQESMKNALEHVESDYVMITDVARACVPQDVITRLLEKKEQADCIVPVLKVSDTVTYDGETINRDHVKLIQTPQLSSTKVLKQALQSDTDYTDDSSAIAAMNGKVLYVEGSSKSKKLTFNQDLLDATCLKAPSKNFFTGFGVDIHEFEEGKELVLGGITFDTPYGFKAHSDGDVLIHAIIDALLGAAGAGDIGEFFPDTDEAYKGADSKQLLEHIVQFIHNVGYELVNVDFTILAQKPKINPNKRQIKFALSKLLKLDPQFINVKATTGEKMGFIGRSEGVAVQAVATLKYFDWKNV